MKRPPILTLQEYTDALDSLAFLMGELRAAEYINQWRKPGKHRGKSRYGGFTIPGFYR
jgi:hypothetical protein